MTTDRIPPQVATDAAVTDAAGDLVVLLDADGVPRGTADRRGVHTTDTPYHLAFSCYLFDREGRVLLTRRSLAKATWPGVWTNSACGHPRPGESPHAAVLRRVEGELGARPRELRLVLPTFAYRATDASGAVENELCPVWVGRVDPDDVRPDPAEVMATAWVNWSTLTRLASDATALISPWSALQVPLLADALTEEGAA